MDFQYDTINGAPVAGSDNFISKQEVDTIYKECNKLRKLDLFTSETEGAKDKEGKLLKRNKGVFLEQVYNYFFVSETLKIYRDKIHQDIFIRKMEKIHPYFRTLRSKGNTSTLVSYYDTSDYYKGHRDHSFITILFWVYEEPKAFTGGDLIIENELTIECKKGRILFMPGWLIHEVTPVNMSEENQGKGLGRYSVSQFVIQQ